MTKIGYYQVSYLTKENNCITYHKAIYHASSAKEAEKAARVDAIAMGKLITDVHAYFLYK